MAAPKSSPALTPSAPHLTDAPKAATSFRVLAALLLLGGLWGSSFPLIKVATPALGPVGVTHARLAIATLVLTLLTLASPQTWRVVRRRLGAFTILAALNVAGPLTLVAVAIAGLNASMAAILNATTPLFTIAVASIWLGNRITWRQTFGVSVGVLGVVVLLGGAPVSVSGRSLLFAGASLSAAVLYALGGVYARRAFPDEAALTVALGQQVAATALMIPVTLAGLAISVPSASVTSRTVVAVLGLGVGATAGGYLLYFWIIRTAGPLAASTVTFVVPLAGAGLGVLWLREPLSAGLVLGLVLILAGVGVPARE